MGEERWEGQEVAGARWALSDQMIYLRDQGLLCLGVLEGGLAGLFGRARGETTTNQCCIELGQPGLAIIIEDENCVDHRVELRLKTKPSPKYVT